MHKNATKCNETLSTWCKNKHGTSKIIDTLETYHSLSRLTESREHQPVEQTPAHANTCALQSRHLHLPRTHLQNRDPCIKLAMPAIDTTAAPDSATSLHTSIMRLPPRPRYATLSRPTAIDAVEEHRSATESSISPCWCTPSSFFPQGESDVGAPSSSDPCIWGFLPEVSGRILELHLIDAFKNLNCNMVRAYGLCYRKG
jgi:hypothetical protein